MLLFELFLDCQGKGFHISYVDGKPSSIIDMIKSKEHRHQFFQHLDVDCKVSLSVGSDEYEDESLIFQKQIPKPKGGVFHHILPPVVKAAVILDRLGQESITL